MGWEAQAAKPPLQGARWSIETGEVLFCREVFPKSRVDSLQQSSCPLRKERGPVPGAHRQGLLESNSARQATRGQVHRCVHLEEGCGQVGDPLHPCPQPGLGLWCSVMQLLHTQVTWLSRACKGFLSPPPSCRPSPRLAIKKFPVLSVNWLALCFALCLVLIRMLRCFNSNILVMNCSEDFCMEDCWWSGDLGGSSPT